MYFGLCVVNDLFGTNVQPGDGQTKSTLQKLRDYFLAALAFPLGTVSTLTKITPGRKNHEPLILIIVAPYWRSPLFMFEIFEPVDNLSKEAPVWIFFYFYYYFQFVVITFWGIYVVDRELVYPERLDKIIPTWLNHVMVISLQLYRTSVGRLCNPHILNNTTYHQGTRTVTCYTHWFPVSTRSGWKFFLWRNYQSTV